MLTQVRGGGRYYGGPAQGRVLERSQTETVRMAPITTSPLKEMTIRQSILCISKLNNFKNVSCATGFLRQINSAPGAHS